jgi:vancomycin resistance protein YoaR
MTDASATFEGPSTIMAASDTAGGSEPADAADAGDAGSDAADAGSVPPPDAEIATTSVVAVAGGRRSRRAVPAFLAALCLALVATLAIVAGAVLGYASSYDGRILAGVRVGDVDLSGLDRAAAAARLGEAYAAYGAGNLVVETLAGDVTIPYGDVGRRPDVAAMVDAAMAVGRDGSRVEQTLALIHVAQDGAVLAPQVIVDEAALAEAIETSLAALDRRPVDATIELTGPGATTTPAVLGRRYDPAPAQAAALAILRRVDAPAETVVRAASVPVAPARGDAAVDAAAAQVERVVTKVVVTHGAKAWALAPARVRRWITLEPGPGGSVRVVVVASRIGPSLTKVRKAVRRKPMSAQYLVTQGGRRFGVMAGSNGRRLDVKGTAAAIAAELEARAAGSAASPVAARAVAVEPRLTTEEAGAKAPVMTLLGAWTTQFPVGDRNYWGANIWLPARYIDGTVLRPGESFEWFSAIGPVTAARGFGPGGVINGNRSEPTGAMGGGMCSSSTTLFNAALRAGLRMGARSNHTYYIDRYPLGLDATVWIMGGGRQSMTFTNDMRTPIFIRGIRLSGAVRYEIWGTPDGRKVSISAPTVRNVQQATTRTVYVGSLPRGQVRQTEWPANGMDVWVTRVVRRGGSILHRDTYYSHYRLWDGVIEVGR